MIYAVDTEKKELRFPDEGGPAHEVALASLRFPGYTPILLGEPITDLVKSLPLEPRMVVVHRAWDRAPGQPTTDNRQLGA